MKYIKDELLFKNDKYIWYAIAFIIFLDWMLFYDTNSWINNLQGLNKEIENLQKQKEFLIKEIQKDRKSLQEINTLEGKERFARETYYLKRDNEDIYVIEYDTIR